MAVVEILKVAVDRVPRAVWRRYSFKGAKPRPHLDRLLAKEEITPEEYRTKKLKGTTAGLLARAVGPSAVVGRSWILRNATCSEAWGADILNNGLRYPPEPGPNPHASRMCQCRSCKPFHPPIYIGSGGVCFTCEANRNVRYHLLLSEDGVEVAAAVHEGDGLTIPINESTVYLPAAMLSESSQSVTTVWQHEPENREAYRKAGEQRRRAREDNPRLLEVRPQAARCCDRCPDKARPTRRYCRPCEKAVLTEMKAVGYLQRLPRPPKRGPGNGGLPRV